MSTTSGTTYQLTVDAHLDDHWSDRLGGLAITRRDDGTSTLEGPVADQAQLYGVLAGLRDIGATLLSVEVAAGAQGPLPGGPARRMVDG